MFANLLEFAHLIVTTFDYGTDVRNKVAIWVEYETQICGG